MEKHTPKIEAKSSAVHEFAQGLVEHFDRMNDDETYRRMIIRGTSPAAIGQAAMSGMTWLEYQQAIESADAYVARTLDDMSDDARETRT